MRRVLGFLVPALGLVLSGCTGGASKSATPTMTPVPVASSTAETPVAAALRPFYSQRLSWSPCHDGDQCASLEVPLDYADPGGRTIELAVVKVPATDPEHRIGAMVVNPGGPGGSGIDYATSGALYWSDDVRSVFDLVGFDPRGVGESSPLTCVDDDQLDTLVSADPDPDTAAERATSERLSRDFFAACMRRDPTLAEHISTVEAAKDMDVLRAALHEERLTFFGASYGTFLGATYADLFPGRVGRFVLDGAIDPSTSTPRMSLVQAKGFETALTAYVQNCVDDGDCYLGDTVEAGLARIRQLLSDLDSHPIPGDGGRELTEGLAVLGIWAPLYNRSYWNLLDTALEAAMRGDGFGLLALSDAYAMRTADGYSGNALQVLNVVNCLDYDDPVPRSQLSAWLPRFEKASPTFGRIFATGLDVCADWSFQSGVVGHKLHATGSAPILVVGTTRDPATPLRWAKGLARQLDNAVLVTRDGDGHTGYHSGNACVDTAVEEYLVSGVVPAVGTTC